MTATVKVVVDQRIDAEQVERVAACGAGPRHAMVELANRLGAPLLEPTGEAPRWTDWALSHLAGTDALWSHARRVTAELRTGDVVYCNSEDLGCAVALLLARRDLRVRLVVMAHNVARPRVRALRRLSRASDQVTKWLTVSEAQAELLRRQLQLGDERVTAIGDHTDTTFFNPGTVAAPTNRRPLVAAVGLERRDFETLLHAVSPLDIDVTISGSSSSGAARAAGLPNVLPPGVRRQRLEWPDLRQLYRRADLVVLPLHPNGYAAGVQSLMEAWACRRPVVATRTVGLREYLDADRAVCVPPGDARALREAITGLLGDRACARAIASRGHERAVTHHTMEAHLRAIESVLPRL